MDQVLTAFFPNVPLPAFSNNFRFGKSLGLLSSKPSCLHLESVMGSVHFDSDSRRKMTLKGAGIFRGGDKHTSKDVKHPTSKLYVISLPV